LGDGEGPAPGGRVVKTASIIPYARASSGSM
jgi:hypothetical protein